MTADLAYWREHWQALGDADELAASGRVSYSPEDVELLIADAVKALDVKLSDIMLDIGAAKGLMSKRLTRYVAACVSMDFVQAFRPDVVGNALTMPFRYAAFDKVLLSGVLLCIPPEWHQRVLIEMRRITRLGGRALVSGNPFTQVHERACVFDQEGLVRLALSCGWSQARVVEINPTLEQAQYYFDMVLTS